MVKFKAQEDGIKFESNGWSTLSAGAFMMYPMPGLATPEEYRVFLDEGKRIIEYVAQIDRNVKTLLEKLDSSPQDDFFATTNNPYVDLCWSIVMNGDLLFIPNLRDTWRYALEGLLIRGVPFPFDSADDIYTTVHLKLFKITADKLMENPSIFDDNACFDSGVATILKEYIIECGGNPDIIRVKDRIQVQAEPAAPAVVVEEELLDEAEGSVAVAVSPVVGDEAEVPLADDGQDLAAQVALVDPAVAVSPLFVGEAAGSVQDVVHPDIHLAGWWETNCLIL